MRINKNVIVFVNAYSTSKYMPHHFISNGYPCVHVATSLNVSSKLSHQVKLDTRNFIESIVMKNDSDAEIQQVVAQLSKYNIKAILPGSESSVLITDRLAAHFLVPKNNLKTSIIRRHKYHMIEAIRDAGLNAQQQVLVRDIESLIDWYGTSNFKKIVIKPAMSTGSDSVYVCHNESDILKCFPKIFKNKNVYGNINEEVVAQEFIDGEEYIVNSVSRAGKHFITDIWHGITLHDGDLVSHDYADLVPFESELFSRISAYVKEVLDVLGIQNSPGHTEMRINDDGCFLIETGARLAGAIDPSAVTEGIGYNQLSIFAESVLNPETFYHRITSRRSQQKKQMRYLYFSPRISGSVKRTPNFEKILNLQTLQNLYFSRNVGDQINLAAEISDIHGFAYLIDQDKKKIETDYQQFKKIEAEFYETMLK